MDEELTYEALAASYDRIYHDKPYAAEAQRVIQLLSEHGAKTGDSLLDIGCGTGQHLVHLNEPFHVTGVDIHEAMIQIARERVPEARFQVADAATLALGERFDALTSLFGVIGYLETLDNLDSTIGNFAKHLEPGAPFVVESWISPARFSEYEDAPVLRTYEGEDCTLARVAIPHRGPEEHASDVALEIEWIIARPGQRMERFSETQHMGLFPVNDVLSLFDKHGFEARYDPEGLTEPRGLFLGTKR